MLGNLQVRFGVGAGGATPPAYTTQHDWFSCGREVTDTAIPMRSENRFFNKTDSYIEITRNDRVVDLQPGVT